MTTPFNPTDYFIAPRVSFWKWADYGELVVWADGRAIAYRPEIERVVAQLAPHGLPPFSAVLLVLSACHENWNDPSRSDLLGNLLNQFGNAPTDTPLLRQTVTALDTVHQAWLQCREVADIKSRLTAVIFDSQDGLPTVDPAELTRHLHSSDISTRYWPIANTLCKSRLMQTLGCIYENLKHVTATLLSVSLQAGVDDVVTPAPAEPLEAILSGRDLLSALEDDPELAGMAELARRVLATLNLPRAVSDPDELPDGGLSDITNRGPLDRLLLSELAHDDLTLSVRVALREALYLRREAPPRTPPKRRAVLIDAGLRLWGVPRVFATAVALAISAHNDDAFELSVARSDGNDAVPVDLQTREGVLQHLEALDHRVHPAAALACLVNQLEDAAAELVLITSDDVLTDPAFIASLGALKLAALYIATVNRQGEYRLLVRSSAGTRVLKTATFDLETILAPRAPKTPLYQQRDEELLPAIDRAQPFPLLLSAGVHAERAWHVSGPSVFSLTRDGRLLRWQKPDQGAEQLAELLPAGHVQWADATYNTIRAIVGPLKKTGLNIVTVDYDGRSRSQGIMHAPSSTHQQELRLSYEHPVAVTSHAGLIYVIYKGKCEAFDFHGKRLGEFSFGSTLTWVRGRFVTEPMSYRWYALGWNGAKVELHLVYAPTGANTTVSVLEGPILISANGIATFLQGGLSPYQFAPSSDGKGKVTAVSRDERFVLYHPNYEREPWPLLVDLEKRHSHIYRVKTTQFVEPLLPQYARPRVLRYRFSAIGIDAERRITLFTSSGAWPLTLAPDGNLLLPKRAAPVTKGERTHFQAREGGMRYDMRFAHWKDGSRATLDSRGLLHLRSSNPAIPECTIVLSEGETSGWVADGRWWGNAYFIGDHPRTAPVSIYDTVLRRFVENLP